MKLLVTLGKVLILLLWLALAGAFLQPLNKPFDLLLPVCGGLLLFAHLLALVLFERTAKTDPPRWRTRLQILLFGILHLYVPAKDSRR
ncbi:hypothetical protein AvCA_19430 [Azotobacter vinelandii CA]|uniref:DUF1145 domain-containing protein n=2 Tax=Azotobacter vinelandii TaxID=354 RepID=C1DEG8_AZOVD|nr:DUF1145 domain-containing protein [Azotobacter vinelandii]ACO78153.1 conserved hypothetical protein [Azotobacter vinelandii DJ]AGK15113.1 hypothetical protein AvCA_19430 [Azotobacter vinelandii CA]AGK20294.1 hypothetical protein AvCA6_19430 [Azotobacter vinelandii CA6]WKN23862.1 DUF1145 domain-containing protein [Azotobacter vinelandii]SFX54965.1 putative membrane protein [Azotobacter vinelandii]